MPTDRLQFRPEVGDVVNVPIKVTAVAGTAAKPTITGTTVYVGFDDAADTVGPLDAIQVIKDN